jgi:hypothetical protein
MLLIPTWAWYQKFLPHTHVHSACINNFGIRKTKVAMPGSMWHLFLFSVNNMVTKLFWRELIFPIFDVRREFSYIMYPQKRNSSATLKQQLDLVVYICRVNSVKKTRLVLVFSCVSIFAVTTFLITSIFYVIYEFVAESAVCKNLIISVWAFRKVGLNLTDIGLNFWAHMV